MNQVYGDQEIGEKQLFRRKEIMAEEKFADGKAMFSPDNSVQVGSTGCWTLCFTLENETLVPGAAIRVSMPHGFSPPQMDNPEASGFVRAESLAISTETGTGEDFDPETGQDRDPGVVLYIERAPLKPGESLRLVYEARASMFAGRAPFQVFVCADGHAHPRRFLPLREAPSILVSGGALHQMEVVAPSVGEAGESLNLRVVMRDAQGNRCAGWAGWFSVTSASEGVQLPVSRRQEDPTGEGVLLPVRLSEGVKGPVRLRVLESETGVEGESNPILVGEPRPFWGDLHACVAEGEPQSVVLDFELPTGLVPTLSQASFHFHRDVRETSSSLSGPGPLHYSLPDAQSDEMLSSHLLEIYSCWGNREHWGARRCDTHPARHPDRTVHAVLSQGIIAGFAAGSNSRFGVGRDARRAETGRGYPAGLTAVYAETPDREAFLTALRERRCYATTGARIVLQAQVSGQGMGQIVEVEANNRSLIGERQISVRVFGTSEISRVEVVRNNVEVCTYRGEGEDVAFQWADRQDLRKISLSRHMGRGAQTCYYYVRVVQADGEMAWSSPVWFVLRG